MPDSIKHYSPNEGVTMRRRYWVTMLAAMLMGAVLFPTAAFAKQPKVDICHFSQDTGTYKLIAIAQKAADKHLQHGDGSPSSQVPGMEGFEFDDNCGLVEVGITEPEPGTAAVDLVLEVSIDGGVTFFDANDQLSAPGTDLGRGALYRLTVINTGTSDLENVVINDPTLNVLDFPVGDLGAGSEVNMTAADIPELDQPGLCQVEGHFVNIAMVDAESVDTAEAVSDSDPAVVRCFFVDG